LCKCNEVTDTVIIIIIFIYNYFLFRFRMLAAAEVAFGDGTFDYAPNPFVQMYTITAHQLGHYVQAVFVMLPDKKKETY